VCQAGDGDRERLLQTSETGEGRAPVASAQLEPGDGGIAAVPADHLPGEGVGLGRPGQPQLITSRPNDADGVPTRAAGSAPRGAGPTSAGWWLTAHADASDPSDDRSPQTRRQLGVTLSRRRASTHTAIANPGEKRECEPEYERPRS
jgi:hypothetical protein